MLWQSRLTPQNAVLCSPLDASGCGFEQANQKSQDSAGGRGEAALGNTAKSVRQNQQGSQEKKGYRENRAMRFRHQRHAAKLLGGQARVGLCRWSVVSKRAGVDLVSSSYAEGAEDRVHYEGLQTCGSVWACPCCGARISETRRRELNDLLAWARSREHKVVMITLTARHGAQDDLPVLLDRMKDAKQRWARHRSYREIKPAMIGSVTATEVTGGGKHGWHPHFHMILVMSDDRDLEPLRSAWLASLRGAGLNGEGAAFHLQDAQAAGDYIAKWGAAEELSLSSKKKGRSGRSPAQLLAASCDDGDLNAGHLWAEYALAFHGRRQLVWSRGLKDLIGLADVEDAEAAIDKQQEGQIETSRANIPHWLWRHKIVRRKQDRRSEILDMAEDEGPEAAVLMLKSGKIPSSVIEEDNLYVPVQGGLIAQALQAVRPPSLSTKIDPETGEIINTG